MRIELLAPAGDFEKLRVAVRYGADAVYLSGVGFGLRAAAKNFTIDEMARAVEFAHSRNVKVYVTVNVFAENGEIGGLAEYLRGLASLKVDVFIVADLGVLALAREVAPEVDVHMSTQANVTNFKAASVLKGLGVKRIIAAREMGLDDVAETVRLADIPVEIFCHGAMCVAYSGRCLLSSALSGRSANRGECSQPCRYEYALLERESGAYFPIEEDGRGAYLLNSRDLCLIGRLPEIINAGVASVKIEGRAKTAFYVASAVRAYRAAIDDFYRGGEIFRRNLGGYLETLNYASHRPFGEGFLFDKPSQNANVSLDEGYVRDYDFVGVVTGYEKGQGRAVVETRNKFSVGDEVLVFTKTGDFVQKVERIVGEDGGELSCANRPRQVVRIDVDRALEPLDFLIKRVGKHEQI